MTFFRGVKQAARARLNADEWAECARTLYESKVRNTFLHGLSSEVNKSLGMKKFSNGYVFNVAPVVFEDLRDYTDVDKKEIVSCLVFMICNEFDGESIPVQDNNGKMCDLNLKALHHSRTESSWVPFNFVLHVPTQEG